MRKTTRIIAVALVATGFGVTPAMADSPSKDGYSSTPITVPPGGTSGGNQVLGAHATQGAGSNGVAGASGGSTAPVAQATPAGTTAASGLPFTGLDVGAIAAAALLLLGLGFLLRRATHPAK